LVDNIGLSQRPADLLGDLGGTVGSGIGGSGSVWLKAISVDEKSNHTIMECFRFRKADGFAR